MKISESFDYKVRGFFVKKIFEKSIEKFCVNQEKAYLCIVKTK